MEILHTVDACRRWRRGAGGTIGFVPTMGFLHEGHLSLMRQAAAAADRVVVSVFVNPKQFGPGEDLDAYPRDFERDRALCEAGGVDALFVPSATELYPDGFSTYVVEESLSHGLCGRRRPGHFRGVCTVVAKLLHIVWPDVLVLGEKDAQQLRVLRRMIRDLNFPVEILPGPTVREADGLAMSSRNRYLNEEQRQQAVCLKRSLDRAEELFRGGERDAAALIAAMESVIHEVPGAAIDYIEAVDDATLGPVDRIERDTLLALAVRIGPARLIDNAVLRISTRNEVG
jgi:pantoate--beta-alanine ligase